MNVDQPVVQALIILAIILCIVAILAFVYMIITFRKINIVAKKIDYFVEDATYKSEKLNVTVDAIVKLSNYVDVFELLIKQNAQSLVDYLTKNKENIEKFEKSVNESIDKDKVQFDNNEFDELKEDEIK